MSGTESTAWKVLILVMFATGMLGVLMFGDREKDVRRVVGVLNEIED